MINNSTQSLKVVLNSLYAAASAPMSVPHTFVVIKSSSRVVMPSAIALATAFPTVTYYLCCQSARKKSFMALFKLL